MKIFVLDDERDFEDVHVTCRTATEGYKVLERNGHIFGLYILDHDLGSTKPGTSGYDVLKWALQNEFINEGASIWLCSSNPIGKRNMHNVLADHGWKYSWTTNMYTKENK